MNPYQNSRFMSIKKCHNVARIRWLKRRGAECRLHPLIHTLLEFTVAQDVESLRKRSRSSAVVFKSRGLILVKKGVETL